MKSFGKENIGGRKIILFGGAMYGEIAYKMITSVYGGAVTAIIDNKLRELSWTNTKVIRFTELQGIQDADVLICAANSFELINKQLEKYRKKGIHVYDIRQILCDFKRLYTSDKCKFVSSYLYGELDLEEITERYNYYAGEANGYEKKIYLPYCVLCITNKCSLKCKNCAAFITHYEKREDYTLEYVKENLGKVLDAVDGIMELELMGGEPFLCKEFNDILSWCIRQKKIRAVKIITNGTIVPEKDTWDILKDNKVKLVIDDYGKYSYKFEEVVAGAEENGVRYEKQLLHSWCQIEPVVKHGFMEEGLEEIFKKCSFRTCIGITNGRFYHCNVAGHMNTVGLLDDEDSDYIQLHGVEYETELLRKKLRNFMQKKYIKACDFCSSYMRKEVEVAEQI